jgi:predicted transcriptional regulator
MESKNKNVRLTKAESFVLQLLYSINEGTVYDVLEIANKKKDWKYTTVLTLMQKLMQKKYVTHDKISKQYIFKPTLTAEEYFEREMNDNYSFFIERNTDAVAEYLVNAKNLGDADAKKIKKIIA